MDQTFEEYRFDMIEFLQKTYNHDGNFQSEIDALYFSITSHPTELISITYEPSLCIILQGNKEVDFGDISFYYNPQEYLLASTHVPARIKVLEASKELPYMSLRIKFSLEEIYEVLKEMKQKNVPNIEKNVEKGLFFDTMDVRLYEPIYKLVKLLESPKKERDFIAKLKIKEILYLLIANEKSGAFLTKFAMEGSVSNKIVNAIAEIKNSFDEKLNIQNLANKLQMSESSFYQYFKTITSMSPLQFQKKLRLEEAKNLLLTQNMEANEVAFSVGYESPSQFSREYSRMYGMSPKAHREYLRNT